MPNTSSTSNNDSEKWKSLPEDRFVAFFDILGFKDSVLKETHQAVYGKLLELSLYLESIEEPLEHENGAYLHATIKTYNFSDSIIFFSKSNTPEDFLIFTFSVMYLFVEAIKMNIPLKGGIAYGTMTINQDRNIYFGQPLIDAFQLEEELKYFGVATHHTIEKFVAERTDNVSIQNTFKKHYFETLTPFKTGKINHYNINWFRMKQDFPEKAFEEKIKNLKDTIRNFYLTTSGPPRIYIDNTISVIENLTPEYIT